MHTVLFDIDGTLISTAGAGQLAFAQTFAEDFGVSELSGNITFAGRSDRAITADLFTAHGLPATDEIWHRFKRGYLSRIDDALAACEGTVLAGVEKLLETLTLMPSVQIGLLTGNLEAGAERKLVHYNLWHWFPFGGFGDVHFDRADIARSAKQAAIDHFEQQPNHSKTSLEKVIVIGDTPNDIHCARAIGAHAVAVPTGQTTTEELAAESPDLLMIDLTNTDELIELLES